MPLPFKLSTGSCLLLISGAAAALGSAVAPQQPRASTPNLEDRKIISAGLSAWRKPGGSMKSACVNCHAPDGFDLAVFNFADSDIVRRASMHVGQADAKKIVEMVHAVRRTYGLKKLLDPMKDRPFQPGGEVLPGVTSLDRDRAFADELKPLLPHLLTGRISSLDDAKAARDEMLAIDVRNLKVGIPFNRWSEDIFHGQEHGLLADWIPDVPRYPRGQDWMKLQDAYIADPSEQNLWKLYNAVEKDTKAFTELPISTLALAKYQSLLIGQHLMREKALGIEPDKRKGRTMFGYLGAGVAPNPMWAVGDYGRIHDANGDETQGIPGELTSKLDPKTRMPQQMRNLRTAWFWLGWTMDQGLERTSDSVFTREGHYFAQALWFPTAYPVHNCFMMARTQLVQSYDSSACSGAMPGHLVLNYSEFLRRRNSVRLEPVNAEHKAVYREFVGNCYRMSLYLLIDTLGNKALGEEAVDYRNQVVMIKDWFDACDEEHAAENDALVVRALAAIKG